MHKDITQESDEHYTITLKMQEHCKKKTASSHVKYIYNINTNTDCCPTVTVHTIGIV